MWTSHTSVNVEGEKKKGPVVHIPGSGSSRVSCISDNMGNVACLYLWQHWQCRMLSSKSCWSRIKYFHLSFKILLPVWLPFLFPTCARGFYQKLCHKSIIRTIVHGCFKIHFWNTGVRRGRQSRYPAFTAAAMCHHQAKTISLHQGRTCIAFLRSLSRQYPNNQKKIIKQMVPPAFSHWG